MKFVYLLKSIRFPNQHHVGLSKDPEARLLEHNAGKSTHTLKYTPWKLVGKFGFADVSKAHNFEQYLKSGSGRAFAKKHLW